MADRPTASTSRAGRPRTKSRSVHLPTHNYNNNNNLFIKHLLYNRLCLSKSPVQSSCYIKHKIKLKDIILRYKTNVSR